MPSPEGSPPGAPQPYYRAAQFRNERPSLKAYTAVQETLRRAPNADLSVYRLWWVTMRSWLVTVLGECPDELLDRKLRGILAAGVPITLPPETLAMLLERRREQTRHGSWVERHFGPPPPPED
jgi:hypothetical protein